MYSILVSLPFRLYSLACPSVLQPSIPLPQEVHVNLCDALNRFYWQKTQDRTPQIEGVLKCSKNNVIGGPFVVVERHTCRTTEIVWCASVDHYNGNLYYFTSPVCNILNLLVLPYLLSSSPSPIFSINPMLCGSVSLYRSIKRSCRWCWWWWWCCALLSVDSMVVRCQMLVARFIYSGSAQVERNRNRGWNTQTHAAIFLFPLVLVTWSNHFTIDKLDTIRRSS